MAKKPDPVTEASLDKVPESDAAVIAEVTRKADTSQIVFSETEPVDPDFKQAVAETEITASDFATFRSLHSKNLRITLEPHDMVLVKKQDGTMAQVADPERKGMIAKFQMGAFQTNIKNHIVGLIKASSFGRDFGIDPLDPTGFWRRHGVIKEVETRRVELHTEADPTVVVGALNAAHSKVQG